MRDVEAERAAFLAELRRRLAQPPTEEELAERRAAFRRMEKLRVKVGPDFNIVNEVRKMRGGWEPEA